MAENPDLKKVIDEMYLGNADISRLQNIFPDIAETVTDATKSPRYSNASNTLNASSIKDIYDLEQGAITDSNFKEIQTSQNRNLVSRTGQIDGQSVRNNFEINWRRFAPMMAEEGLTADRVFSALYHFNDTAFKQTSRFSISSAGLGDPNPVMRMSDAILDYHDRPAMEAVMKVFEYIDPSNSDQIYDEGGAGLNHAGKALLDYPRTAEKRIPALPVGLTLKAEHLGRTYHTEELKAAKRYWQTPVTDEDLLQWSQTAAAVPERTKKAKAFGIVPESRQIDLSLMEFSDFAGRANKIGQNIDSLPGEIKAILPFVKGKNLPFVLKGFSDREVLPSVTDSQWDIGAVAGRRPAPLRAGKSPGDSLINRTSLATGRDFIGVSDVDLAAAHFLPSASPGLQDFLFKSPSAMAAVEEGLHPILAKIDASTGREVAAAIKPFLAGGYGQFLSYYFENKGKNEQSILGGIKNINDVVDSWIGLRAGLPTDVSTNMPREIETSGEFLGKKLKLRLATAEEAQIGANAINIKYGGNFCVGNGAHQREMKVGAEFGYLISEEGTPEDIGFALSRGNGFFDWGYKQLNSTHASHPFVKEIQQAFPSNGDAATPLGRTREISSFFETFRQFFGTQEASQPHKAREHLTKMLGIKKNDPETGLPFGHLDRPRTLNFHSRSDNAKSRKILQTAEKEIKARFKLTPDRIRRLKSLKGLGIGIAVGAAAAAFPSIASAATGAPAGPSSLSGALITGAAIIGGAGAAVGTYKALQGLKTGTSPAVLGSPMAPPGSVNRNYGSRIYNSGFVQNELDLTTRGFFAGLGSVINDFGLNRRVTGFDQSGKASGFIDSFFGRALGSTGYVHPVYRAEEAFWQVANNLDDAYQGWKNYISAAHSNSSGISKFFHGARYHGFKLLDQVGDGWLNKQLVKMGGLSTIIAPALMAHGAIGDFKSGYRQAGIVGGVGNTALGIATGLVQNKVIAGALLNPMVGLTGAAVAAAAGYTAFKIFDVRNQGAQYIRSGRMGGISWNRGPTPGMSSSMGASIRQRSINAMENSRFSAMKAIGNESYMMSAPKARYSGSTAIYGTSSMLSY
jgi:hypothetical protein